MTLISPMWLGLAFGLSELALSLFRRARGNAVSKDGGSLAWFWIVIPLAMFLACWVAFSSMGWRFPGTPWPAFTGEILVIGGLMLRWYAILYLGRWFTVNVAIAADQPLVDSGPYRYLRHPSYTGALLALAGLGLALGNALSLGVILVLCVPVFLHRIRLEERVLAEAFGARWDTYRMRTWRLLPGVY
ncbi:MAG TPA: isoprenylcysteine carboxylmethyltransferase family protein [Dyella sp.]|uniref:methyltransferase family protein n=1 Tax=Dyella sp. TaxID=1869338 RepID=UPI002F951B36